MADILKEDLDQGKRKRILKKHIRHDIDIRFLSHYASERGIFFPKRKSFCAEMATVKSFKLLKYWQWNILNQTISILLQFIVKDSWS